MPVPRAQVDALEVQCVPFPVVVEILSEYEHQLTDARDWRMFRYVGGFSNLSTSTEAGIKNPVTRGRRHVAKHRASRTNDRRNVHGRWDAIVRVRNFEGLPVRARDLQ